MNGIRLALLVSFSAAAGPVSSGVISSGADDPLHFFAGVTESVSTTKIMMQKPFVSRTLGRGKIKSDGSLDLVQHVREEGRREFDRQWQIRQVGPGRFVGTMNEAIGPVTIEKIGDRYRFRLAMKGHLTVEEWLTPQRDMAAAQTQVTIRKFGMAVAHGNGWIRRTS